MKLLQAGDVVYCVQCERIWIWGHDRESQLSMCRCFSTRWELIAQNAKVGALLGRDR